MKGGIGVLNINPYFFALLYLIKFDKIDPMQRQLQLDIIVWKEDEHYVARCLNVDISSFGNSKQEALKNVQEAIELYLEDPLPDTITKIEALEIVHSNVKYA